MKIYLSFALLFAFSFLVNAQSNVYMTEPAISPDNNEVVFVSGGDIWTAPTTGGTAQILVAHPATESRPIFSPDGKRLAFVSTRTGNGDIYILNLETNDLKRLTFSDSFERLDSWSRDGNWIYFSSTAMDIAGMNDIFRVRPTGGTSMQVSKDLYTNEFGAVPSPDGSTLAFSARGISVGQWWRKGRSHIDETEIWIKREGANPEYQQISERGAKQLWTMWSADGKSLFYVSDRDGTENIWSQAIGGQAKKLSNFKDGRVLWANISYDGKQIVFERNFKIWKIETGSGKTSEVAITLRGTATQELTQQIRSSGPITEFDLSPDGKKVAFITRGEVFAASAKDGGDSVKITKTAAAESFVTWAGDSKKLVYASERNGGMSLYQYDFSSETESRLTEKGYDASPIFSPDGKSFAFIRDARQVFVYEIDKKSERKLCDIYTDLPPLLGKDQLAWSPDGKWIGFLTNSPQNRSYTTVNVVSFESGEVRPISSLANSSSNSLSWSPDGTFILFDTSQRTEDGSLARIELNLTPPKFREDEFRDLFKQENPRDKPEPQMSPVPLPSPSPVATQEKPAETGKEKAVDEKSKVKKTEIFFDNIRQRLSVLNVGLDVGTQIISPDGKTAVILAAAEGQANLYEIPLDELAKDTSAKQLTSTPRFKNDMQFSPDGKEVFYLENGRISAVDVARRVVRSLSTNFEINVNFNEDKIEILRQGWRYLRDHFYDEKFHGIDWNATYKTYEPLIKNAQNSDEVTRLMSMMVGELNASHLGVNNASGNSQSAPVGKLGLRFDRKEYEENGRLKVTEIIALSPSAVTQKVKIGDFLLTVDGENISNKTNIDELLENKVGKRVVLHFSSRTDGAIKEEVILKPISTVAEKGLLYRQWVENNRAYVEKVSGGKLGYVHIPDMSSNSLNQLYIDLDVENQRKSGVVVDVRNNNGGFVNVYVIDVLARQGYLTFDQRGFWKYPARSSLGQRALERPTILITNQHSLSDAEDFTEGYRTLKLGKVVGEPTAGWIIFTWNARLYDGSTVRLPRVKVLGSDGKNMELNPRQVDFPVTRPIGESLTNRDSQLDKAAAELLKQIGN